MNHQNQLEQMAKGTMFATESLYNLKFARTPQFKPTNQRVAIAESATKTTPPSDRAGGVSLIGLVPNLGVNI
jgi:hypothetical protein